MNPNAEVRTYSKPSGHRKVAGIPVSLIALALALSGVVAAVIVSHYQSAPSTPAGASISWASAPATSPNINTLVTGQLQAQGINGFTGSVKLYWEIDSSSALDTCAFLSSILSATVGGATGNVQQT